jgi:hypothetical protein
MNSWEDLYFMSSRMMVQHVIRLEQLMRCPLDDETAADIELEHEWILGHLDDEEEPSQIAIRARLRSIGLSDGLVPNPD